MRATRLLALVLLAAGAAAACKPPRSPRKHAAESLTGAWTAESVAPGDPSDTSRVSWRVSLEQRQAGKLSGRGSMERGGSASDFRVSGLRDETSITLWLDLPQGRVKYHGGVPDVGTITGELYLPDDTIAVTFSRR